jgi:hypothetical protein
MSDWEFSDIETFQHSGKVLPLFMTWGKYNMLQDFISPVINN